MSSETQSIEEFSGIEQPPLLEQIKRILDEYRNDVQIIKELVQNADDAEATSMKILYEGRTINPERENEAEYRKFLRAPALVFYNDQTFTDDDWRGIRSIYTSVKRDDPLKIGRFGLGFKSVFHLTDFPCIISGENALFINPHASEFGKICVMVKLRNLKEWHRLNNEDYMSSLGGTFGFSEDTLRTGLYQGTMFWFPLRQCSSPLSDNIYQEENVLTLLQAFITESHRSLLFLKTLCSIKLFVNMPEMEATLTEKTVISSNANGELVYMNFGKDSECFTVEVGNKANDLPEKRQDFLRELQGIGNEVPDQSKHWVFNITIKTVTKRISEETKVAKSRWLIVNYLKGGEISEKLGTLLNDKELGYPHIVGLAAPIDKDANYSSTGGHVFCYQPLPQENVCMTGLPVHVNGFFALSQNRRHVRWPDQGDTTNGQGDKKIEWNIVLRSQILPEAYENLIAELVSLSQQEDNPEYILQAVYNAIPDLSVVDQHWSDLASLVPELCKDVAILYTKQDGGKWIRVHEAVFTNIRKCVESEKDSSEYSECQKECFTKTVFDLLISDKVSAVEVPDHIVEAFEKAGSLLTYATPAFLKSHMNKRDSYQDLDIEKKQDLFEYVMLDSSREGLEMLELLPLEDGTFVTFAPGKHILLEGSDVIEKFPGYENDFVRVDLRTSTRNLMKDIVKEGMYCVRLLCDDIAVQMVTAIIKKSFGETDQVVIKDTEVSNWMPWIRDIWGLIQDRFRNTVKKFTDILIFPKVPSPHWSQVSEFSLLKLGSVILHLPSLGQLEESDHIKCSFALLSVSVIEHISEDIDAGLVSSFLHDETSDSIVSLLDRINVKQVDQFNSESVDECSAAFLNFLAERIHTNIGKTGRRNLQEMKLFRGHKSMNESELVSLKRTNDVYEGTQFPVRFPMPVVLLNSNAEKALAVQLDVNVVSELELVRLTLRKINEYSNTEKQKFIFWIITKRKHFEYYDVQEALKEIAFLETKDGLFYRASELFDPSDKLLCDLFKGESVFPELLAENEEKQLYINGLRLLGLKTADDLASSDIDHVSDIVHEMAVGNESVDKAKCVALMNIMNKRSDLVPKEHVYNKRCIIIEDTLDDKFPQTIPMKNTQSDASVLLCMPSEIQSVRHLNLVGTVVFVIDCKRFQALSDLFEWEAQPKVTYVVEHLFNVVRSYEQKLKATYLPLITSVYEWLSTQDECNEAALRDIIKQQFVEPYNKFVWDGNEFQPIENMYAESAKSDVDLRPFLHPIPSEIQNLGDFFQLLGCKKSIGFDIYVDTLKRIKSSEELSSNDVHLAETLTDMAVAILNRIKKNFLDEFHTSEKELYFPTVKVNGGIQMMPAKSCTFCDEEWLTNLDFQLDDDIHYVHPELPVATAEALGVPSLRQQMMSDAEAFAEWGQEEPLTRRLRNLLKEGYVDGFSVAKELFQNADDAGAKKLCILFDERENMEAKTQLISDGMADCQGPAIWVYNDAQFTESDFRNITKLSGATKEDDATKIGKFGLGFCAVYNITDVPSFISGESIVIFDPDMSHLRNVLPGRSPGLRVNFRKISNLKMLRSLKNQFLPFEGVFDCKIIDTTLPSFDGTLFRLPLRNRASDICDVVYSSAEVKSLFEKIMLMAANMLLFNQNVVEFRLLHIPKSERNPSRAKLLFEINKSSVRWHASDNESLNAMSILVEASRRKWNNTLCDSPLQAIDKVSVNVCNYVDPKFNTLTDKVDIKEDWLVSWSTGTERKCISLAYEEKGAVPLGAVAVPIHITSFGNVKSFDLRSLDLVSEWFYSKGHLFFFLPLPIQHRFPFHINSQFTVTTDRRHLKTSTEDDKNVKMKKWNAYLLKDSVTQALLVLLEHLHTFGTLEGYKYDTLWPRQETASILEYLPNAFYQNVVKPNLYNVFEKEGKWFDISRCVFLERHFRSSTVGDTAFEVLSAVTEFVIDVSEDVYEMLKKADQLLIEEKTVSEERFFMEYFLPNLEKISSDKAMKDKRTRLLSHAVDLQNGSMDEWLKENKCIPSQPNGILKIPKELIDTESDLAKLFVVADGLFPEYPFTDKNMLIKLQKLGLMYSILSNSLLIDRAVSIERLNTRCSSCALERSAHLLSYLCENIENHSSKISDLGDIKFIPVQAKPTDWIFEWHADMFASSKTGKKCKSHKTQKEKCHFSHFDRPSNVYHSDRKNIVCCIAFVFDDSFYFRVYSARKRLNEMLNVLGMKGVIKMEVEIEFVVQQLTCIASSYKYVTKDTSSYKNILILQDIYQYLENACQRKNASDYIMNEIHDKAIVYVSHSFVSPRLVAKNCFWDCKPYLFSLKDSPLERYIQLRKCLGIVDYFEPQDIALLLQNIKNNKIDTPLSQAEIRTVINIMYCLESSIKKLHGKAVEVQSILQDNIKAIYGPDENGILRDCTTMCFNDYDGIEKSDSMIYAHVMFPPDLAKFFGVNPKLVHSLEESSEDIEDFYQEEPLVTRLNRLVEGYPCDSGIFKELIQNADDARATEIHFVKDYTMHPTTNIIDPRIEVLQGPALVVFNNSAFSNDDLKGITMLGRGSKSDDPSQTGRYGVGFNAVYNLTDAPSFYTRGGDIENGETICFFDPLAQYIPNVTRKTPGKRYKNVNSIKALHSDMMDGYHEKDLMNGKQGTIFRFPLRTEEMAKTSEIKSEHIDMDQVSKLLKEFSNDLSNVLIFLKNLKTVKISTCKENHCIEEFCIDIEISSDESKKRNEFVQKQAEMCNTFKRKKEDLFKFGQHHATYKLSMNEQSANGMRTYDYIVVQVIGFKKDDNLNQLVRDNLLKGKIGLLPHGGVALRAKRKSSSADGIQWETNNRCKAFCFLPLPIETGLPVHVHGYFALDHETRRSLWKSEQEETCYRSLWNKLLIEHVVSVAYIRLLRYAKAEQFREISDKIASLSVASSALDNYEKLFPLKDNLSDDYWKYLMASVYKSLVAEEIDFLPVQNITANLYEKYHIRKMRLTWTSLFISGSKFPAYIRSENTDEGDASQFNSILRRVGMRIVYISNKIKEAMDFSEVSISFLESKHVIDFLCSSISQDSSTRKECNIETEKHVIQTTLQSVKDAADVLLYCLKDIKQFKLNFENIPLMITGDCYVRTVPRNGFFLLETMEKFCTFFPSKRQMFLHSVIAKVLAKNVNSFQGKLERFKLKHFVSLVQETKPIEQNCKSLTMWNKNDPAEAWVRLFWEFFCYQLPKKDVATVFQEVEVMKYLPIIPVVKSSSNDLFLAPPANIKLLIDLQSFSKHHVLHSALESMNLPHLSEPVFSDCGDSESFKLLTNLVSNFEAPMKVLECFELNECNEAISNLSDEQTYAMLQYFNDFTDGNISSRNVEQLKSFPIFLSHFGKRVALKRFHETYIVPLSLPVEGINVLADEGNVLLLRDTGHTRLYKNLNIKGLSLCQVYILYIIPNQDLLPRACFYEHLAFLSEHVIGENEKDIKELHTALQRTAFVEAHEGQRVKVCDLFDPHHAVFRRMCRKDELVPDLIQDRRKMFSVLNLFRKIGLKKEMTVTLFERFANSIATTFETEHLSKTVLVNSEVLTKYLLSMNDAFFTNESFDNLSKIRFVAPHTVSEALSSIKEQFNCKSLICFEGAVVTTSENICWTVSNILPTHADPTKQKLSSADVVLQKLKIRTMPSLEAIVKHCRLIGETLEKVVTKLNPISRSNLYEVMNDIYRAMSSFPEDDRATKESLNSLSDVPLIYYPDKNITVAPKRVVITCKADEVIPPYLMKHPDKYASHTNIFLRLGAAEEPSCDSFACVLKSLKDDIKSGEEEVLPHEYANAVKAMSYFFKYLTNETDVANLSCGKLFLLSENKTLEDARNLVLSNNAYFKNQLSKSVSSHLVYLIGFDSLREYRLRIEDCVNNLHHLSQEHRPHLLTEVVTERVVLDNIRSKGQEQSSLIERFLYSKDFVFGFLRLYRHVLESRNKNTSKEDETQIVKCLKTIKLKECSGIETVLYLKKVENRRLGKESPVDNTNEKKYIHTEKRGDNVCIYFDTSDAKWKQNVKKNLTVHLNEIVGDIFDTTSSIYLMEIVGMFEMPHEIDLYLSQEKVKEYTFEPSTVGESPSYPTPGEIVPRKYHRYLDNDYGIIHEHDYKFIAFEIDDPAFDTEEEEQENHESEYPAKDLEATYQYVHITRQIGPQNELPLLQEYEIDCGSGTYLVVKAFQLYKFVRNKNTHDGTMTEVVIYNGNTKEPKSEQNNAQKTTPTFEEVCSEISKYLKEAWKKEEYERRRIVKRLMLKWHPDKNPDNVPFCTKVFQYIQQCISLLEKGQVQNEDEEEGGDTNTNNSNTKTAGGFHSYSGSYGNTRYDWYWRRYERGRQHNENTSWNSGARSRNFNFHDTWRTGGGYTRAEYEPYHWYSMARLWFKQAEYDLRHARTTAKQSIQFNWQCYNAHQAAEKALKAGWYAKDAKKIDRVMSSHNLVYIAGGLEQPIQKLAKSLSEITGDYKAMRYPRSWPYSRLPSETYSERIATLMIDTAQKLLTLVHSTYIK